MGVDVLHQIATSHTCKSSSRRWSVAVVFNILDSACINSYIVYCTTTKVKLSIRQFLLELIKELCKPKDEIGSVTHNPVVLKYPANVSAVFSLPANTAETYQARKRKKCQFMSCRNKSSSFCQNCKKVYCGKTHTKKEQL